MEGILVPLAAASLLRGSGHRVVPDPASFDPPIQTAAGPVPRAANQERALLDALLARAGFDPAGFDFAMHPIRESADLGCHADLMVTVTCRSARASRTYLSRAQGAAWLAELSNDLRAGVFGA